MNGEPCTATPGCTGTIEDGYCNVCGSPPAEGGAGPAASAPTARRAAPTAAPATASAAFGTGFVEGSPNASAPVGSSIEEAATARSGRTSSARLATAALGSARTAQTGSKVTRRVGTTSTRLRGPRLGAGLTTVPSRPAADPMAALMTEAVLPERKRFCSNCGTAVGRGRDGKPGRTEGFCPNCRTPFSFTPQLQKGDVVGGQYEVVGCLAYGGLGWIYLARDRNVSGRWVVLKGLLNSGDPDAYAAAVTERQFLAEVEHPLIVEIYNFVLHEGAGYIVMEYVGGPSLKQILKERLEANGGSADPLPVDQALAFVLEVMPAFAYLHDHGLLYCDFKPDNMIQVGDQVKLIDLGGVRRADDDASAIYGTVGYQAPEVPEDGPSIASDVYTIGRTLASLVLDFRGNQTTYVASLPPVSETPLFQRYDSFYRLVAKACAPDPQDRFATVDEMRGQLLGVLREVVATDRGPGHPSLHSTESALFEAPVADVVDRPLPWDALPLLKIDESDAAKAWLAGVNVADPIVRLRALALAPTVTVEVRLARARAAIEAERWDEVSRATGEILAEDPWEWRAVWMSGLAQLAHGDHLGARASFNTVYGQVPGELAPKLALAAACESSGEPEVAESLYVICARSDANYTAPAAFGLARVRQERGDLDGALDALDIVTPTRSSFLDARRRRAELLAESGRGLPSLSAALSSVDSLAIDPRTRLELTTGVLESALELVRRDGPAEGAMLGTVEATEPAIRDGLEASYRALAASTREREQRLELVDKANAVRRWTMT
ncbi:serine/threonine-protein kinase PknG [Rathayibacter caricis]|uniref:serine/threonine-protein kinase n=1 Tax=Rathayibacter caricis TaxID=110936 RepID=UPI001FB4F2BD|nr:serine/threonine-protein kinase [Rathayibacter caricis]MCJ1695526.1 serine/threonine-protein kinase PknG [Rathayibacter caricis]